MQAALGFLYFFRHGCQGILHKLTAGYFHHWLLLVVKSPDAIVAAPAFNKRSGWMIWRVPSHCANSTIIGAGTSTRRATWVVC